MKLIIHNVAAIARSFKILDETAYRNLCIKLEFEELKNAHAGETVETIMQKLAEKHFLSLSRIREICYPKEDIRSLHEITIANVQPKRRTYATPRRRP